MIDLHSHVLPALDDGALDVDDSAEMLRTAAADGIETVCATPHIRHDHDVVIDELFDRVEKLNRELRRRDVRCRVLTGGEVAETAVRQLSDDELDKVSLGGGGRWILLEPRPGPLSDELDDAVEQLAARGYGSVVAHPERHLTGDFRQRLKSLASRGALIQATAATFLDRGSEAAMLELAEAGLVHVLGSDAHSSRYGRPLALSRAFASLSERPRLRERVGWMAREAPEAIVAGRPLEPPFG